MPSPRPPLRALVSKEMGELFSARAFWVMLLVTGPLVGVSFISAVTAYGELSAAGGSGAGVGEAFSPLIGVVAPTFSAYELVSAFLLPFVAIRVMSGDRLSGASRIEAQAGASAGLRLSVKAFALISGWAMVLIPGFLALAWWKGLGGFLDPSEVGAVILGHLLNAGLTLGLAVAAASLTDHPATAAIVTLAFTVGTWVLGFVAAVHGGLWERLAGYTPPAMVAEFQHGLVRADTTAIGVILTATGLALGRLGMRAALGPRARLWNAGAVFLSGVAASLVASASLTSSVDVSANRYNSFSRAEEEALRRIPDALTVDARLAPADPRRYELERRVLGKLRRILPRTRVVWSAETSTGLFEQASDRYGEVAYEINGHRTMNRDTSPEAVLETLFTLSGVSVAADVGPVFRGYPLAARAEGAPLVFHLVWPALVLGSAFLFFRSQP